MPLLDHLGAAIDLPHQPTSELARLALDTQEKAKT
jgi:hypothetical protein